MTTQSIEEVSSQQTLDAPVEPLIVPAVEGEEGYAPEVEAQSSPPIEVEASTGVDAHTQQRLDRADQLEDHLRQSQLDNAVRQEIQTLQTEMGNRGYTAEDQQWLASRYGQLVRQVSDERQGFRVEQEFEQRRYTAAHVIGKETGVAPELLMKANDTPEMRDIAAREKRYLDQEKRLSAMEKRAVPAQNLNQIGMSRVGGQAVNSDNADALWLAGRITDDQYRKATNQ